MLKRMSVSLVIAAFAAVLATVGAWALQKQTDVPPPGKVTLGEPQVKQLLLLMDTDQSGKISKQEWMNYMSKEFDRLDVDKSGELDPKELAMSPIMVSHPPLPQAK
jgi:EF hand domain-containing protein